MKYEKLIYGLSSVVIIVGAVMNILHVPYGTPIVILSLVATSSFQWWHVTYLKKKIKELQSK